MENIIELLERGEYSGLSEVPKDILHGDMPGDKVEIGAGHIAKARTIFPKLAKELLPFVKSNPKQRAVVCVCGGSGVGKSETASLLSHFFREAGIGSYTLSGDNYPRRIPMYNDAERLHIFRESAIKGMVAEGTFGKERFDIIHALQLQNDDANPAHINTYEWYESYIRNGRKGLEGYLGTSAEIRFEEIEDILKRFKDGEDKIWLKRMGRGNTELWYDEVDFSNTKILVIEWTHGNSDHFKGVDVPILLNSTPKETLEHRRSRNRDGAVDSPFTTLVLEIEQKMLEAQAPKAKIIVSKSGELLSFDEYRRLMDAGRI